MRTLLLVSILLAAPFAAAGPITDGCHASAACIQESNHGSCPDEGYESRSTEVNAGSGALVARGFSECYGTGGSSGIVVANELGLNAGYGEVWYSDPENGDFHGCWLYASEDVYQPVPCLPALGWGGLLP